MINKQFKLIDKNDIDALIANEVAEDRTLEYKEILPGNLDGDNKKEFLADVSAFANAVGGDIIYGISEKRDANRKTTGIPEAVNGLAGINVDEVIRRLDSMILDGIAPRISGVDIKPIDGFANGPVILIRIPKSWASPHMIAKSDSRFYSRNNAGKYPLDVTEIRSAFALSELLPEKVRRFRDERISRIVADETPVILDGQSRTILHILPVISLDPTFQIDLSNARNAMRLFPIGASGMNSHYNFDGFLTFNSRPNVPSGSYVQVFRNGAVEAVECYLLSERSQSGIGLIPSVDLERQIIDALKNYLDQEKEWGIEPPYFVMLSLVGVKNYQIRITAAWFDGLHPIERNVLMLPDVLVDGRESDIAIIMRPVFDALWQSSGLSRSMNYDQEGNWKPRSH